MSKHGKDRFIHPALFWLGMILILAGMARWLSPTRDRRTAMQSVSSRPQVPPASPRAATQVAPPSAVPSTWPTVSYPPWFLDISDDPAVCGIDWKPPPSGRLEVHHQALDTGIRPLLAPQDLAFVGWVSSGYHINPHFLLAVMMAESAGNCAAVSYAGAQGCFQITYTQGAGQLQNSYPERVASWYWAPRSNKGPSRHRRPGEALGYWPDDLYIPETEYFGLEKSPVFRQFRMTQDSVATLMNSTRDGDTEVSSVANFSFGINGSALYYHYLNHYLLAHQLQLEVELRDLAAGRELKGRWMAAAYNQGSPRSLRTLASFGAEGFFDHTDTDVVRYAETVTNYCHQLQLGAEVYAGVMTWGQFSDFLEQLRWTYSEVPIDWIGLQQLVRQRYFSEKNVLLNLETDLLPLFAYLRQVEPLLIPETPIIDHRVRF